MLKEEYSNKNESINFEKDNGDFNSPFEFSQIYDVWDRCITHNFNQIKLGDNQFRGKSIFFLTHLEQKTLNWIREFHGLDCQIIVSSPNNHTSKKIVVDQLMKWQKDIGYSCTYALGNSYNFQYLLDKFHPDVIFDDGGKLIKEHCLMNKMEKSAICIEQTTRGGNLIRKLDEEDLLTDPVFLVSQNKIKKLVDNFTGTSEAVASGMAFLTNTQIRGKNILIVGYGAVGKGLASLLKNFGANVIITELDAFNSCQAYFEMGIKSKPIKKAIKKADFVLTCTGQLDDPVIDNELFMAAKSGAYFANAGSAGEIPIYELDKVSNSREEYNAYIDIFTLDNNKKIFLLAKGQPINLTAGYGNAIESIACTFLLETLTAEWALQNIEDLEPKIYQVPDIITKRVSKILCEVFNLYYEEDDI